MFISTHEDHRSAYLLSPTQGFDRARRKLTRKHQLTEHQIKSTLETLRTHPFHPFLKSHHVHKYAGEITYKIYSSSIDFAYRILWYFESSTQIILYKIGPHSGFGGVY